MKQFCLPLFTPPQANIKNFLTSTVAPHFHQHMQHQPRCMIYGTSGSGKTHILQAVCHQAIQALFFDARKASQYEPALLENLNSSLTCIDNIEAIFGNESWEHALFSSLVQAQPQQRFLLSLNGHHRLNDIQLPDLRSRLQAFFWLPLPVLNDQEKKQALTLRGKLVGLKIKPSLLDWLFKHYPRDNHFLFSLIDTLQKYCVDENKEPSIPLLKHLLLKTSY